MDESTDKYYNLKNELDYLNLEMVKAGLNKHDLLINLRSSKTKSENKLFSYTYIYGAIFICILITFIVNNFILDYLQDTRCLIPNNYMIWEATRPLANCSFCMDVTMPIILHNVTKKTFKDYAYSSKPIIVKGAAKHWKAMKSFDFNLFKDLYEHTNGAYQSVEERCQYLHFRSDLFSLKEVFSMSDDRVMNKDNSEPWYVGWGNCHPEILETLRQYYTHPKFIPDDAEMPNSENIFIGYDKGAVFHLDYIPRLMWQGQVKGNKIWQLAPVPECERHCQPFSFIVEPGDIMFLDTRVWYHATTIPEGQFSLTVQSEYG